MPGLKVRTDRGASLSMLGRGVHAPALVFILPALINRKMPHPSFFHTPLFPPRFSNRPIPSIVMKRSTAFTMS